MGGGGSRRVHPGNDCDEDEADDYFAVFQREQGARAGVRRVCGCGKQCDDSESSHDTQM